MKTLCVALLLAALPAAGEPIKYRGQKATLLIPDGIPFNRETFLAFPVLTATFESDGGGGVRFTGIDSASRIPRLRQCTVNGPVVLRKKPERSRLEVICPGETIWHLFTPTGDLQSARTLVDQFVVPGTPDSPAAQALLEKAVARVASRLFAKELASVPEERRSGLVAAVRKVGAGGIAAQTYRDALYLSLDLGPHVKPDNEEAGSDKLEILVPRAELAKLADDEVTSQQLVNASVVRLDANRIEGDLSQQ